MFTRRFVYFEAGLVADLFWCLFVVASLFRYGLLFVS